MEDGKEGERVRGREGGMGEREGENEEGREGRGREGGRGPYT